MHSTAHQLTGIITGIITINAGIFAAIIHLDAPPSVGAIISIVVLATIATIGIVVDAVIARQTADITENSRLQLLPISAAATSANRTIIEVKDQNGQLIQFQQVTQDGVRSLVKAHPDKAVNGRSDPNNTGPHRLTIAG